MYADTNDRPGLDERYISATNSSNLTLNPDADCDATHLIAAGLLGNRMGEALMHLRAEWDGAEKPRKATEDEIVFRAELFQSVLGHGKNGKPDLKRARTEALLTYATAMRHRAHRMPGWLPAIAIMAEWAKVREVDRDLLSPALYHFLNPTCPVCDGLGHRKMDDAPVLGKRCHHCDGSGKWPRPAGSERVHDWLKGCAGKARRERGGLMRGESEITPMEERLRVPATQEARQEAAEAVAAVARGTMGKALTWRDRVRKR